MEDKYVWRITLGKPDLSGINTVAMAIELRDNLGKLAEVDYVVRPRYGGDTIIAGTKHHDSYAECLDEMTKYAEFISKYGPISNMTMEALRE